MQPKDVQIPKLLTATSDTIPGSKVSESFGLPGLPNVSGMIPVTTFYFSGCSEYSVLEPWFPHLSQLLFTSAIYLGSAFDVLWLENFPTVYVCCGCCHSCHCREGNCHCFVLLLPLSLLTLCCLLLSFLFLKLLTASEALSCSYNNKTKQEMLLE